MRARILSSFSLVSLSSCAAGPSVATAWRVSMLTSSAAAACAADASVVSVFPAVAAVPSVASAFLLLVLCLPAAIACAADATVAFLPSASVVAPSFVAASLLAFVASPAVPSDLSFFSSIFHLLFNIQIFLLLFVFIGLFRTIHHWRLRFSWFSFHFLCGNLELCHDTSVVTPHV